MITGVTGSAAVSDARTFHICLVGGVIISAVGTRTRITAGIISSAVIGTGRTPDLILSLTRCRGMRIAAGTVALRILEVSVALGIVTGSPGGSFASGTVPGMVLIRRRANTFFLTSQLVSNMDFAGRNFRRRTSCMKIVVFLAIFIKRILVRVVVAATDVPF